MKWRSFLVMLAVLVVLGGGYLLLQNQSSSEAEAEESVEPRIWAVDWEHLTRISIAIPETGVGYTWVRRADHYWYFDEPDGPRTDMDRWGGGIPLLVSNPRADRVIARDATTPQLESYGVADPHIVLEIELEDGYSLTVGVGDATPGGDTHYVRRLDSRDVFTVDHTWVEVIEGLVRNPPYPPADR